MVGDPVTVKGTERKLDDGNGWTPWNLSWDEFIKGSALPVPPELAAAGPAAVDRCVDDSIAAARPRLVEISSRRIHPECRLPR